MSLPVIALKTKKHLITGIWHPYSVSAHLVHSRPQKQQPTGKKKKKQRILLAAVPEFESNDMIHRVQTGTFSKCSAKYRDLITPSSREQSSSEEEDLAT